MLHYGLSYFVSYATAFIYTSSGIESEDQLEVIVNVTSS